MRKSPSKRKLLARLKIGKWITIVDFHQRFVKGDEGSVKLPGIIVYDAITENIRCRGGNIPAGYMPDDLMKLTDEIRRWNSSLDAREKAEKDT